MSRTVSHLELRDVTDETLRRLERGERFTITRDGIPTGELTSVHPRRFVNADTAIQALVDDTLIDPDRFHQDIDRGVDQTPPPRP
ncbi:MAG: hypothetical protein WC558_14810 [Patulibacter sp.]